VAAVDRVEFVQDAQLLHQLENICADSPWSESQIQSHVDGRFNRSVVAYDGLRPVGYMLVQYIAGEAELFSIGVVPSARGKGVATSMFKQLSVMLDVQVWLLEVRTSNKPAITLYSGLGFEQIDVRPNYYSGPSGSEDALIFQRKI